MRITEKNKLIVLDKITRIGQRNAGLGVSLISNFFALSPLPSKACVLAKRDIKKLKMKLEIYTNMVVYIDEETLEPHAISIENFKIDDLDNELMNSDDDNTNSTIISFFQKNQEIENPVNA